VGLASSDGASRTGDEGQGGGSAPGFGLATASCGGFGAGAAQAAMLGASGHWGDNAQLWRQEEASGREADGRAPLEFPFSDLTNMHSGFWLRKIS
jgi:hypothetical protein